MIGGRIQFDCNECCEVDDLNICEFIAENCPGGFEETLTTLVLNASAELDYTDEDSVLNNIPLISTDANNEIVVGTDGRLFVDQVAGVDQNLFETITVDDVGQADLVADSPTDTLNFVAGTGITLTTDAGTDTLTITATGGGGGDPDQNLFETITVDDVGQSDLVADNTTDTLNFVAGTGIQLTTDGATDTLTITATGAVMSNLCDADLDTCFINELTADEDWIRFSIGISDVKTAAGFINDTNVAYGRGAGDAITLKTGDHTLIGHDAGTDLVSAAVACTFVGTSAGAGETDANSCIGIGEGALSNPAVIAGSGHTFGVIAIGERAYEGVATGGGGNIAIGFESMAGAGDHTPGGGGPSSCIAIGTATLQNLWDTPQGSIIAIGDLAFQLLEFGSESIAIGEGAGKLLVGIQTTDEAISNVLVGDGAASPTTAMRNAVCVGWRAGGAVTQHGTTAVGWNANVTSTGTIIPSSLNGVYVGGSSGQSTGGFDNVGVGHNAFGPGTLPEGSNYTPTRSMGLGANSWYGKGDLNYGVAVGPGVGVSFDETLILGFVVDPGGIIADFQLKVGIGVEQPTTDLHVVATSNGGFRYVTGNEGAGKVLGCDANGVADWTTAGSGAPGGSTTEIQFNTAGAFAGDPQLTYTTGTDTLTAANIFVTTELRVESGSNPPLWLNNTAAAADEENWRIYASSGGDLHIQAAADDELTFTEGITIVRGVGELIASVGFNQHPITDMTAITGNNASDIAITNSGAGSVTVNGVDLTAAGGGTTFLANDGTYKSAGGGGGSAGFRGDHIQVNLTANTNSVADNGGNRCTFDNVFDAGNGALSLATGKVTLAAGKRYRISAFAVTTASENVFLYDFTNGTQLSPQFNLFSGDNNAGCIECIVEPSGTVAVGLSANSTAIFESLAAGAGCSMLVEEMPAGEDATETEVNTTDATVTTCGTFTTASNQSYLVTLRAAARETVDSDESAGYVRTAMFTNDGGTLALVGSVDPTFTAESTSGWDCTLDFSGVDIRGRVTGAAATDIDWKTRMNIIQV